VLLIPPALLAAAPHTAACCCWHYWLLLLLLLKDVLQRMSPQLLCQPGPCWQSARSRGQQNNITAAAQPNALETDTKEGR
jgi:hypothetical protein